jgi:succinyl-CoA synthetase beta subunit
VNLHEYQARELFRRAGIPVTEGEVATTPAEARAIAARLGRTVVVKAQVHAGGRGKAGGVKLAANPDEAEAHASKIIGMTIKGLPVRRVLVAVAEDIAREYYAGLVLDRRVGRVTLMVSPAGGIDIEEVARETPEKIFKFPVDPLTGLPPFRSRTVAFRLDSSPSVALQIAPILEKLVRAYHDADASLAEINPLVVTPAGRVMALDAKVVLDDNGLFRHADLEALRDPDAEAPAEVIAREAGLSFVKLDGSVGCVVNGAGLAMATMDLIQHFGGRPANFLDIGGSSNPAKVTAALRIITSDPNVKGILFNIFGGITRCDDVAEGLMTSFRELKIGVPVVVRLTGTNEEKAREMLRGQAGVEPAATMDEAVRAILARVSG